MGLFRKKNSKNGSKNAKDRDKGFALRLGGRGLAALVVLLVLGMAWAFVLGVLVGRGYKPETAVPELSRLMPEQGKTAEAPAEQGPGVLKPEELEFFEELQKKPEVETPEADRQAAEAEPDKTAEAEADLETTTSDEQTYMYIYQVAAYRKADQARSFRARLEALGLSAGVESASYGGNTWHRVLVHFKGTPVETRGLKKTLAGLGVEKPLLRGKKPL